MMMYYLFEGYIIKFQPQLDIIRDKFKLHHPSFSDKYPWTRKLLINQAKMNERVKMLWAILRYQTKKEIKRKRIEPNSIFFAKYLSERQVLDPFYNQMVGVHKNTKTREFLDSPQLLKIYPVKEQ